jgi:hypothetical protein
MNSCVFYGNHLIDFHQYITHDDWDAVKKNVYNFLQYDCKYKKVCIGASSSVLLKGLLRFGKETHITHLEIYDSFLFRYYVKLISEFCTIQSLQHLFIRSCFDYYDIEPFLVSLPTINLKKLTITGTKLCKKTVRLMLHQIPSSLEELDLSNCFLHNNSMRFIASSLMKKKQIKCLILKYNRFLFDGIICLAKVLPYSNLVILNLYGNRIGNSGIETMTEYLPQAYSLRELGLSKTFLHSTGFSTLCSALPYLRLTTLHVAENYIRETDIIDNFIPQLKKTWLCRVLWFSNLISYHTRCKVQSEINPILEQNVIRRKNHNNVFHFNMFLLLLEKKYNDKCFMGTITTDTLSNFDIAMLIKSYLEYS